jgi:hypothetical protein
VVSVVCSTGIILEDAGNFTAPGAGENDFHVMLEGESGEFVIGYSSVTLQADGTYYMKTSALPPANKPAQGAIATQVFGHRLFQDGTTTYSNPIDVLLCLLLSRDGDKTNHATYDILPKGMGVGLPAAYVDVTSIESLRDTTNLSDAKFVKFTIPESTDIKKWIEEQILRPNLLF